ncbi:MAG: hypothetical protein ABI640_16475 [Gammaproteobacteria bacterium]
MNISTFKCAVIIAAATVTLGTVCAQESGKVMIDVADCIKLTAPEARLACYESRAAAVSGERAAQAAAARPAASAPTLSAPAAAAPIRAPEPAPAATEPAQSRTDRQSRREDSDRAAADAAAGEIVSRVKDVREVLPNAWHITLENGQVWRQTVSKHYELRAGAQVRIYTTHWGSAYRLSADNLNGYIQVERAR